jgi:DNA-binding NarL/FixJ family response regulator/cytochrome c-type biogenesis protein CcmH/NrfG
MADSNRVTIVLADEDALRRDGLAAVLQGIARFEVIGQAPDGADALERIRTLRPNVAVVDLNIPKLHGIELIRRVRSEGLPTKIVILSGSSDDDIIREVVRAGGDAYLLKNGPARHLVDAISYVCDGGQYFSPQLRRDGLDRRLLEETARPQTPPPIRESDFESRETPESEEPDYEGDTQTRPTASERSSRYSRPRRPLRRASPQKFHERIREDTGGGDLADRDYEILDMMAEGIRPILDRLEEIEGRVNGMESGQEPVPDDPRRWLTTQISDTLGTAPAGGRNASSGRSLQELEARLPQLIEQAVTARFQNLAEKLHEEIEDTHLKTLETFVKNIQVKLVQRVSALELDMSKQAEAVMQLREYSQRTDDNLSRLISGVDKLAQDLPRHLLLAPASERPTAEFEMKPRRRRARAPIPKVFWVAGAVLIFLIAAGYGLSRIGAKRPQTPQSSAQPATLDGASQPAGKPLELPPAGSDSRTKLQAAQEYADRKDYATAEDIYKQLLKTEPNNADAIKALASVLYREDKIEESAAVLDKLPR